MQLTHRTLALSFRRGRFLGALLRGGGFLRRPLLGHQLLGGRAFDGSLCLGGWLGLGLCLSTRNEKPPAGTHEYLNCVIGRATKA